MTHVIYGTITMILLAILLLALPYAKKGYDQTVLEKYGATITSNMGDLK